jgi:AbiV family abortive infection protein
MNSKNRDYTLTADLLRAYIDSALVNAQELLEEATLLFAHAKYPRAYFLSASTIEEAGKAVQAFEGLGRNLKDSAVTHRLKLQFEDHSQKVTAAFSPWLQATPNLRDEVKQFVNIMISLKIGREASMYTDINAELVIVTTPQMQVRKETASECIQIAGSVLSNVRPYVQQVRPTSTTRVQDAFFSLKPSIFQKMVSKSDFWDFYLAQMESGNLTLESAVTGYNDIYFSKGTLFQS